MTPLRKLAVAVVVVASIVVFLPLRFALFHTFTYLAVSCSFLKSECAAFSNLLAALLVLLAALLVLLAAFLVLLAVLSNQLAAYSLPFSFSFPEQNQSKSPNPV